MKAFVNRQLRRIDTGQSIEPFNPRFTAKVLSHVDNKDLLRAERHKLADDHLRKLVNSKKMVCDSNSNEPSGKKIAELSECCLDDEMSDNIKDEVSDMMSIHSDRTLFGFNKEEAIG